MASEPLPSSFRMCVWYRQFWERPQGAKHMANKPVECVQTCCTAGTYKANLTLPHWLTRGFMAGLYIAVGGALATVCSTGLEKVAPGFKSLISGSVFPVGLIAIVLTGMELFTGDAMLMPVAALHKKVKWSRVLSAWFWIFNANF